MLRMRRSHSSWNVCGFRTAKAHSRRSDGRRIRATNACGSVYGPSKAADTGDRIASGDADRICPRDAGCQSKSANARSFATGADSSSSNAFARRDSAAAETDASNSDAGSEHSANSASASATGLNTRCGSATSLGPC